MKIFLVGFMGSGKSCIGKLLSERLQLDFIETDSLVEKYVGKDILSIFNSDGEQAFRKVETDILHELIKKPRSGIFSTGGGLPCFKDNMKLMNFFGTTIFLKRTVDNLHDILKRDNKNRPLLSNQPDLRTAIAQMLAKREGCYNMAAHIIDIAATETNEAVVERIVELLRGRV